MKKLQRYASYCSKQQHEAEDLLQDALLEAVRQGRAELSLAPLTCAGCEALFATWHWSELVVLCVVGSAIPVITS